MPPAGKPIGDSSSTRLQKSNEKTFGVDISPFTIHTHFLSPKNGLGRTCNHIEQRRGAPRAGMEENDVQALDKNIRMTTYLIGFGVDVHYLVLYDTAVDASLLSERRAFHGPHVGLLACPPYIHTAQRNKGGSIHRPHDDAGDIRRTVPAHDRTDYPRAVLGCRHKRLQSCQARAPDDLQHAVEPLRPERAHELGCKKVGDEDRAACRTEGMAGREEGDDGGDLVGCAGERAEEGRGHRDSACSRAEEERVAEDDSKRGGMGYRERERGAERVDDAPCERFEPEAGKSALERTWAERKGVTERVRTRVSALEVRCGMDLMAER